MTDRSRLRLVVLGVLVVSLVATLLGRLWYLQVLAAPQYRTAALENGVKDIITQPPRGQILDDRGKLLVDNKPALVVSVDRTALDRLSDDQRKAVLVRLAGELHTSYTKLNNETTPCTYHQKRDKNGDLVRDKDGNVVITSSPTPCNNQLAYQPVVVSRLKPTIAAARKALRIKEMPESYPGVSVQLTAVRHYPRPDGALASAILGYTQLIKPEQLDQLPPKRQTLERNAIVGATGLEAQYERYLRGKPGVKQVTVDHVGAVTGTVKNTQPKPGDNLITNIDAKAQAALEQQLQEAINSARSSGYTADFAAGVVMNVRTGGVVAMASLPTYQPNHAPPTMSTKRYQHLLNAPGAPLLDKAFQGASAPGSSFKLISASGLLWDGTATRYQNYDCSSTYNGASNFEGEVGGYETLHKAIVESCDTVFYRLAVSDWNRDEALIRDHKRPVEGVQHIARAYGLGEDPGIDLPGAATGHIADRHNQMLNWKAHKKDYCAGAERRPKGSYYQQIDAYNCRYGYKFMPGDQMNEDIGQGTVTASPLQMAVAYSAMANGGTVFEPRVAKAIVSPTGKLVKRIKAPVRDHLPVSKADLDYVKQAMYGVTSESGGTGTGVFAGWPMGRVLVGGKTGTAELTGTSTENGCWFASFAGPAGGKPQYVAIIEVNKADQGAVSAAPFVRNMWEQIYGIGGHKAIFPNGVPPTQLPKIRQIETTSHPHHHGKKAQRSTTAGSPA